MTTKRPAPPPRREPEVYVRRRPTVLSRVDEAREPDRDARDDERAPRAPKDEN